jgi:hypothetical protein
VETIKEFELNGITIRLRKGHLNSGAQWSVVRDGEEVDASAVDVLAIMLIMGAELEMGKE